MFFLIPILIIIYFIRSAVEVKPVSLFSPYNNSGMALTVVFGVAPFVIALGSYLCQYFSVKDPLRHSYYQRFGLILPYLVFISLIYPQSFNVLMAEGTVDIRGGGWLYAALFYLTNNFQLIQISPNFIGSNNSLLSFKLYEYVNQTTVLLAYYSVFFFYLVVCDRFIIKGSKDFGSFLPTSFMSTLRQGVFGVIFVFIFIFSDGFENILKTHTGLLGHSTSSNYMKLGVAFFDSALFLLTPLLLIYFLPLILPLVAGWKTLPEGEYLDMLRDVSKKNDFKYNKIYLANKPGLVTAGIIGYFSSTRNLVFTKDLLQLLNEKEIEAVMLHEIGHARYKHIFTYYLFFIGLIFLITSVVYGMSLIKVLSLTDSASITIISFALIILGIRYGWGWLSRQCERQADLHAAERQKTPEFLVSSFYKISNILGGVLDRPSWHHGTLRSRIANLENAFAPNTDVPPAKHHRFVSNLKIYIFFFFFLFFSLNIYESFRSYSAPSGHILYLQTEIHNDFLSKNYHSAIQRSEELLKNLALISAEKEIVASDYNYLKSEILYNLACAYSLKEEKEKAFATLFDLLPLLSKKLVIGTGEKLNVGKFKSDTDLDFIRDDDRFSELLEKIKEVEQAFKDDKPNPFMLNN